MSPAGDCALSWGGASRCLGSTPLLQSPSGIAPIAGFTGRLRFPPASRCSTPSPISTLSAFSAFWTNCQLLPGQLQLAAAGPGGSSHRRQLQWPTNVVPVFQPPVSPERGPIERLWQKLRDRFRGRNFATLQELQQWLFHQLHHLSERTIRSLTNWKFIRRAVRSAKKCNIIRNWYQFRVTISSSSSRREHN